jgi:hypothetical protein
MTVLGIVVTIIATLVALCLFAFGAIIVVLKYIAGKIR